MKALSIQQPWAWLIANGYKDVENRTWRSAFCGPVLIHAGKKYSPDAEVAYTILADEAERIIPRRHDLSYGGIVGVAEIITCVTNDEYDSPWLFGPFAFIFKHARPLPFLPCRGQLGFFDVELPADYLRENALTP